MILTIDCTCGAETSNANLVRSGDEVRYLTWVVKNNGCGVPPWAETVHIPSVSVCPNSVIPSSPMKAMRPSEIQVGPAAYLGKFAGIDVPSDVTIPKV
jgi:hypothetical protein